MDKACTCLLTPQNLSGPLPKVWGVTWSHEPGKSLPKEVLITKDLSLFAFAVPYCSIRLFPVTRAEARIQLRGKRLFSVRRWMDELCGFCWHEDFPAALSCTFMDVLSQFAVYICLVWFWLIPYYACADTLILLIPDLHVSTPCVRQVAGRTLGIPDFHSLIRTDLLIERIQCICWERIGAPPSQNSSDMDSKDGL